MTRADAIARAREDFRSGAFLAELDRRVAYKTESQNPSRGVELPAHARDVRMRLATDGPEALLVLEASLPCEGADLQPCVPATLAARVHAIGGAFACSQPAGGRGRIDVGVPVQPGACG